MKELQKMAVILTCYNRRDKTIKCLTNLFKSAVPDGLTIEVFLVDDGSTDGTADGVKAFFPSVKIFQGDGNLFWNRGMHYAWSEAVKHDNYDYFFWLNDDTFLFPQSIETIINSYKASPLSTIVCASVSSETDERITYGGFRHGKLLEPNGTTQECDYFNGNCVLVPARVYEKIGSVDSTFHHSLGDFDYGLRAGKMNIGIVTSPIFVATCEKHDSFPNWCSPKIPLFKRLKFLHRSSCDTNPIQFFIFDKRHNGLSSALLHFLTIHIRALIPSLYNKRKSI